MVAGGGASVIYADTVGDLGYASELGNYAEYSGAPNEEEVLQYARVVIDCATADPDGRKRALLIGGGIANFTDVAATFNGIIRALREKESKLKASRMHIYVRRGGPNYQTGLAKMRALGEELGVPFEVYGPEATMTGICKQAIDCFVKDDEIRLCELGFFCVSWIVLIFRVEELAADTVSTRLKTFYSHWKETKSDLWGSADVLAIATPPASEDLRYLKSSALNIWLLGYEFPETIMVFTKKQIHFLCSQKKASLLGVVKKSAMDAVGADVVLHVKAKTDDGTGLMDGIFSAVRSLSKADGNDNPIVGYISRETPEGKLLETWDDRLKNTGFQLSDVTNGLSDLFAVKDQDEIMNVKKAGYLTYSVMNKIVVPKLENVIDEEKKISHSSLMDETEKAILEPTKAGSKAYEALLKAQEAAISALKPGNKVSAAYQAALSVVEKDAPELVPNLTKMLAQASALSSVSQA
ncbi:hypothetical protein LWI29_010894 [Acer saccharum]|uniref:FACT complex subunit n=1 Tax=Acer saccharum TaxID=4024 RepID=A0AA39SFR2_ACESA|nr:hypothetical protein LWI29_010894 [Acer saccharum]